MADNEKSKIDPRFIEIIEGREFIKFGGLLHLAHMDDKRLTRIETEIIQLPTAENGQSAIIRAVVESKEGDLFTGIGDCSPANCHPKVSKHSIRIAETRAVARCLKLYVDSPYTCLEELSDPSDVLNGDNPSTPTTGGKTRGRKPKEASPPPGSDNGGSDDNPTKKISEAQRQAILNLSKRRGLTLLELELLIKDTYNCPITDLSQSQASRLIHSFQKQKSA